MDERIASKFLADLGAGCDLKICREGSDEALAR
jgi:hypothetical protein